LHLLIEFTNDDFSFFQKKVPGVYYLLGGSNFEKGVIAMPHSANFAVDEEAIRVGVQYFSTMLLSRLNN
jgi:metal-dependent amidase/aminoacylase/carboxypeptidase family protein